MKEKDDFKFKMANTLIEILFKKGVRKKRAF
jgi:hypothetical protein